MLRPLIRKGRRRNTAHEQYSSSDSELEEGIPARNTHWSMMDAELPLVNSARIPIQEQSYAFFQVNNDISANVSEGETICQ
jgi:hypothetical protein